jgi:hypothetical protein
VSSIQGRFAEMDGRSQKPHRNLIAWQKGMDLVLEVELSFRLAYLSEYEYNKFSALLDECLGVTYGLRKSLSARTTR